MRTLSEIIESRNRPALPPGWQFWIALEAEACYQVFWMPAWGTARHIWYAGSKFSRARFWTKWTQQRQQLRVGRRR